MIVKTDKKKQPYPGHSILSWLLNVKIGWSGLIIEPIDGITDGNAISIKSDRRFMGAHIWETFYN